MKKYDYVSPNLQNIKLDPAFPYMIIGNTDQQSWQYLRREIPHNWYVDQRHPFVGFLSRDEAHILYNTALKFTGKRALEIGCWMGWSACYLIAAGVNLDIVDPLLEQAEFQQSVINSLQATTTITGISTEVSINAGYSPQAVLNLVSQYQRKWSLIFIDGNHDAPGPLNDAIACETLAEETAMVLFHDLASPDVAQGLDYFQQKGWKTMIYQTMQIMGVAWRGNIEPVQHQPDPKVNWILPKHLADHPVSGSSQNNLTLEEVEFNEILHLVRPYTLLSTERLKSLYRLIKHICLNDLPGNIVECGSYKGGAIAFMAKIVQKYSKRPRYLYAFDTFTGMPEPTEIDQHNNIPANDTGFGVGTLKAPIKENLEKICQIMQVQEIVIAIPGLFAETLPKHKLEIGGIALLHADGDWYESTMDIFNNLYDQVINNGFIQVDDYGHWAGCKKALHDFAQNRSTAFALHQIDYTGVWFQKNDRSPS